MSFKLIMSTGALAAFLTGTHLGAATVLAASPLTTYTVQVATGCFDKAGTDANVMIVLFGQPVPIVGRPFPVPSISQVLDTPGYNDFENGDDDAYLFVGTDLGDVSKIKLSHDNTRGSPGWLVKEVRVYNHRTGNWRIFPVERWLSTDNCDGNTFVNLNLGKRPWCTPYYYGLGSGC